MTIRKGAHQRSARYQASFLFFCFYWQRLGVPFPPSKLDEEHIRTCTHTTEGSQRDVQ
jgi:hypothetical protein